MAQLDIPFVPILTDVGQLNAVLHSAGYAQLPAAGGVFYGISKVGSGFVLHSDDAVVQATRDAMVVELQSATTATAPSSALGRPEFVFPSQMYMQAGRVCGAQAAGNGTTIVYDGLVGFSNTGTATTRSVTLTNSATKLRRVGFVSAATVAGLAGTRVGQFQFSLTVGFTFCCQFLSSDAATVAGARMFCGLSSNVSAPTNVEPNTVNNCIGVAQLSTGGNLQLVSRSASAATTLDLGSRFPANTLSLDTYTFWMHANPNASQIVWRLERRTSTGTVGVREGVVTTDLPVVTQLMNFQLWRCNNATALAVGVDFAQLAISTPDP